MADLDFMLKKRSSLILWLIIGIGLIAVLFFLTRQPNKEEYNRAAATITSASSHAAKFKWNTINFNAPAANYNEITNRDIIVRGTNNYAIYSVKEELLFDKDKSALRSEAIKLLHEVANSIEQRYTNGLIRIYEHNDNSNNDKDKFQLTQQRVETIRNWLLQNGNIATEQLTIQPIKKIQLVDSVQFKEHPLEKRHVDIVALRAY